VTLAVGGLQQDRDLQLALSSPLKYRPEPFQFSDIVAGRIYTLRGARRVGKTVALKLFLSRLINEQIFHPHSIGWWNGDTSRRADILESQILNLLKALRSHHHKHTPLLLIIDEVTSVIAWQRALKRLKDHGKLEDVCIILTGSSAYDLKVGVDNMAGRRGVSENLDRILYHMSYATFRNCVREKATIADFIKVGGYPFRVEEFLRAPQTFDPSYGANILEEIFMYEITRRRLNRSIALEVLSRIAAIGTTATSYDSFSKTLLTSKDTVRNHLDALGDAFILCTYSSIDLRTFRAAPKKARKFLWFDPSFGSLVYSLRRGPLADDATVVESIVGAELIRRYETFPHHGFSNLDSIFTWKGTSGYEVDFVAARDRAKRHKNLLPVEVKYQNSISEWDWQTLLRSFGDGVLVTKEKTSGLPASKILLQSLEEFLSAT
jgi:hypothetical protein